jgi:hypothetical protein
VIIRVQYSNNVYDMISEISLQSLIDICKIKTFYCYSEKRWIAVGADPIRKHGQNLAPHAGPEKRTPQVVLTRSSTEKIKCPQKGIES